MNNSQELVLHSHVVLPKGEIKCESQKLYEPPTLLVRAVVINWSTECHVESAQLQFSRWCQSSLSSPAERGSISPNQESLFPPSAGSWYTPPWRAASAGYVKQQQLDGAAVVQKQQQSTSMTTGVGHILVKAAGQEKWGFFAQPPQDLKAGDTWYFVPGDMW